MIFRRVVFLLISLVFSFISLSADEDDEEQSGDVKVPINLNHKIKNLNVSKINQLPRLSLKNLKNEDEDKREDDEEKDSKEKEGEGGVQEAKKPSSENPRVRIVNPPKPKTILDKEREIDDETKKLAESVKIEIANPKPVDMNMKIKLDFKDENLINIIKLFSELLQKNFILPENLGKTKINLMAPQMVTVREAYKTFLTLLAINDFSVSEDGKFTIVEKEKSIPELRLPFYKGADVPDLFRMVATILKFEYVEASDVDKVLKLFRDKGATSVVFDEKTLIVIDYAANIKKIMNLIKELDQPSESDKAELYFIKLNHVLATDARKILEDVFKDFSVKKNKKSKKSNDNIPALSGVGANRRQNAQRASLAQQADESDGFGENMYIHIVADERSQQIIVLCNKSTYNLILQIVQNIDREIEGEGQIHVVKLQNAKSEDMLKTLNSLSKNKKSSGSSKSSNKGTDVFEGDVQISSNEATNSLVIVSSLQDFRNLKKVIEKLDIKRKQVFVEAAILEVSVDDNSEYGNAFTSAGFEATVAGEKTPIFFGKALATPTPGLVAGMVGASIDGTAGISGISLIDGVPSLGLILNAAQNDSSVNVVSTPHLLTTDNEEAEITVGETVPFPSGNIISSSSTSTVTYTREDVALKLKIKPQINESGYMTLEINQEMTELGAQTDFGYKTTKRQAKTIINAENEQTIVIGGLMKDTVTESENKIPFLGDIPVLGALFKYKKSSKVKVNLLLILTPHVVESKEDFERILNKKMNERDDFAKKFYGDHLAFEDSTYLEKKRGALLSIVKSVCDQNKKDEEELLRLQSMKKKDDSILVTPDGEERIIEKQEPKRDLKQDLDENLEEEMVPELYGE